MGEARTVLPLPFLLSRVRTKSATMNETKTKQKKSDAIKRADNQHSETSTTRTKGEDTQKKKRLKKAEKERTIYKRRKAVRRIRKVSAGESLSLCVYVAQTKKKRHLKYKGSAVKAHAKPADRKKRPLIPLSLFFPSSADLFLLFLSIIYPCQLSPCCLHVLRPRRFFNRSGGYKRYSKKKK